MQNRGNGGNLDLVPSEKKRATYTNKKRMNKESNGSSTHGWLGHDWRIWLGIVLTGLWLIGGGIYLYVNGGISAFLAQQADQIGSFLEGFFAPLAFLWLVLGLFMQQRELALNTEVLQKTNANSERQTQVLETTELRARQTAFFQIAENVKRQTGNMAGLLVREMKTEAGEPVVNLEEWIEDWAAHQEGKHEVFTTALASIHQDVAVYTPVDSREIYFGDAQKTTWSQEFLRSFQSLIRLGEECDSDGTIVRTITQTTHGVVYGEMLKVLKPPACWVLLDEVNPFVAEVPKTIHLEGEWHLNAVAMGEPQTWVTKFWQKDGHYYGLQTNADVEVSLVEVELDGNKLFIRLPLSGAFLILTGIVENDTMRGRIDSESGTFATFAGSRVSNG